MIYSVLRLIICNTLEIRIWDFVIVHSVLCLKCIWFQRINFWKKNLFNWFLKNMTLCIKMFVKIQHVISSDRRVFNNIPFLSKIYVCFTSNMCRWKRQNLTGCILWTLETILKPRVLIGLEIENMLWTYKDIHVLRLFYYLVQSNERWKDVYCMV